MRSVWLLLAVLPLTAQTAAELAARGAQLLEANRPDEAEAAFTQSLRANPGEFEALSGMGFLLYAQDQFASARGYLDKAVAVRPQSFQARFLLGATLVQLKQSQAAIIQLRHALARNPGHLDARKLLSTQLLENRQYRDAIPILQPALETPPFDEEIHLLMIEARQASGDSAAAFALAQKAAARFPSSAQILAWLGFQLQFAGRYEEAKSPLLRAMEMDPTFPVPYQVLGDVFLKEENYPEATKWLTRASQKLPDDIDTLLSLSRAQAETNASRPALETLTHAARIAPQDARVHFQLSRLYFRLGDEEKARRSAALSIQLRDRQTAAPALPGSLRHGH